MLLKGLVAGSAGTLALDLVSYGDMLLRARALASDEGDASKNRRSAAGAILCYGVGLGTGIGYALLRPAVREWLPWPIAGVIVGATTLVV